MWLEETARRVPFGGKQREAARTGGPWTSAREAQLRLHPSPSRPATHIGQTLLKDLGSQDRELRVLSPFSFSLCDLQHLSCSRASALCFLAFGVWCGELT